MRNCNKWIFIYFIFCNISFSQISPSNKQKELEQKRIQLRNEIKKINNLLFENKKKKQSALSEVENLELKITVRNQLIKVNNQQANYLDNLIIVNQKNIEKLRVDLKNLKSDYAMMIKKAYQSKSAHNRLMFLFSSENFVQAYRRLTYLRQYTSYRKQKGEEIKIQTDNLQELNKDLIYKKREKDNLINEKRKEQKKLISEQNQRENLLKELKYKARKFENQIINKQKLAAQIDSEIQRLIKEAIAASNIKAGKTPSSFFSLTPEAKILAENFKSNKGKLPWPVSRGVVIQKYGTQSHPIVKTTKIRSNGITIATEDKEKIRVVFQGEVMSILSFKNSNPTILVKHGNYITAYKNLSKVFVKKGEKVVSKQVLGEAFTNSETGKTTIQFSVFNTMKTENPADWLLRM
ncbi:MAG: peptidase M23 [Flavobacteriaceae bacterium]|nr:peptidase M23 [Flavobacteriaceae bacterium]|tara:strand:- start:5632 stop:6852 length:1221 start_codon:yes stop_codon:yes gene_type:complete